MSPSSDPPRTSKRPQKSSGLFSQFLELFGITPSVPSDHLSQGDNSNGSEVVNVWRCRACHNPAKWIIKEERWRCPNHPQADVVDNL
jgi:hypothetical protein